MESRYFVEISTKQNNILINKEYEVDEINPLLIPEEGYWFTFYEKDEDGMRYNYTPKFYFGKRIDAYDIVERAEEYPNDEFYSFLRDVVLEDQLASVVINNDHTIICCSEEEDGITVDEYALAVATDSYDKIVDRRQFLQGISHVLNKYEKENFRYGEEVQTLTNNENSKVVVRSMYITKDDEIITSDCRIMSYILNFKSGMCEKYSIDKLVTCTDAEVSIATLYDKYPYLEPIMERIKIETTRRQYALSDREISSIATDVFKEKTEDFSRTLKK